MFDFNFNGKQDAFDTLLAYKTITGLDEQKDKDENEFEDDTEEVDEENDDL